jgi:FkbM family methyltransferase
MRLADLSDFKFNSSVARALLSNVYREGNVYKIPFGPLRGSRLVYRKAVNFHTILGLWDTDVFRFLHTLTMKSNVIDRHSLVADVGANLGFYSLWFAQRFRSVLAFEPAPEAVALLRSNLAANEAHNVTLVEAACGSHDGTLEFFVAGHHHRSSIHESWAMGADDARPTKITVPVVALDSYCSKQARDFPDLIKMDIEGGGTAALPGAAKCFEMKRPFLLIESHTPDEDAAISSVLTGNDYEAYRFDTRTWVDRRDETHPNPGGVWGTMFACPAEKRKSIEALT